MRSKYGIIIWIIQAVRHLDRILSQRHIRKVHACEVPGKGRKSSFIRWGDLVDNYFVRYYYDIPSLKDRGGRKYTDEFEKAYVEFFNERKQDLGEK